MNPQDYNNQDNNQPPDQSTQAWFNNIDTPPAAANAPSPAAPEKSSKRRPVIIACIILVIALLIPAGYLLFQQLSRQACLSAQDYKELFGIEMKDAIDARSNFYTESIIFDDGSSEYNELTEKDTETLLESIGQLYAKHHKATSIVISLSTTYAYEDGASAATERLEKVKASLIKNGVDISAIKTTSPLYAPLQPDDEEGRDDAVLLKITSEENCRE